MAVGVNYALLQLIFQDSRYNADVDRITGYITHALLCMPVQGSDGEVVAVVQVINKSGAPAFTKEDEKVCLFHDLLFC